MKDYKPKCDRCGLYCGYRADNGTYYGCDDPENPEPFDPTYFCKKCARKEYKEMKDFCIKNGQGKISCIWWIKPEWYMKAIKDIGFELKNDAHIYSLVSPQNTTTNHTQV